MKNEGDIWNDIASGAGFGKDYRYQQSFDLRTSPKLPSLWISIAILHSMQLFRRISLGL